jgi:Zn-dependent M28 family amino/carboxypeptidase
MLRRRGRRTGLPSLVLAAVLLIAGRVPAEGLPATPVDPGRLSEDIRVLASDAFEGRGPGTRAEAKVLDFLEARYRALGLLPAGEDGGFTQNVPLRRFALEGAPKVEVRTPGGVFTLTQGKDIAVMPNVPAPAVDVRAAPLVFIGYGVKAPERGWDDFKGADLRGKIAVVLINDPDFEAVPGEDAYGRFDGRSMTYYGRWTYKFEEAAREGALGLLIVHETAPAAYGWATVANSYTIPQFDIVRKDPYASHPLIEAWIEKSAAEGLFKAAGLDFEALKRKARSAAFRPVPLGATFSAAYAVNVSTVISHNVAAKILGAARPDEAVLVSAHWDHLGVGPPDARGVSIYHGAVDNASGVAGMLELARLLAKGPRPARTILFVAMTAEEKGLLGSEYYALHPLFPLARTVADLNLDTLQVAGPARDVGTSGEGGSTLEDLLAAAAVRQGRVFVKDAHLEEGHFYRADHFSLAKAGTPAITLEGGLDLYAGGVAAGEAAHRAYVSLHYHQPSDEWRPDWDLRGAALDLGLYLDLARTLANSDLWPEWKTPSQFKTLREATAADRARP